MADALPAPGAGLLISRDLFFASKVTGTAAQLGLCVETVPDVATALERVRSAPIACLFCDLEAPRLNIAGLIGALPRESRPKLVAFGPHVAQSRLQSARDAGCDEVLPRSGFSARLPELLRRYLT
jgi:CheY-like chemotaxis protein